MTKAHLKDIIFCVVVCCLAFANATLIFASEKPIWAGASMTFLGMSAFYWFKVRERDTATTLGYIAAALFVAALFVAAA